MAESAQSSESLSRELKTRLQDLERINYDLEKQL